VCEVNFPTIFQEPLWVASSLVMSDLRRTLASEGLFGEKWILVEGGRCSVDVGETSLMSQGNGIV
jgi:hypothetical protein